MPQANITYDSPYNRKVVATLNEMDEKHWQKAYPAYHPNPLGMRLSTFHGEMPHAGMVGGGSHTLKYNPSGNSPSYPPHNLAAGLAVSSGGAMLGGPHGIRHPALAGMDGAVGGGPNTWRKFKNTFKDIGHALAPAGKAVWSDVVAPVAREVGPELVKGAVMGALGAGKKRRGRKPKAEKKGGFNLRDVAHAITPIASTVWNEVKDPLKDALKRKVQQKISGSGKKVNKRAEIVKKVMKEKGMKMIEASKYVKQHGLY